MLMPIRYVFVFIPDITASIGFKGPMGIAVGGGGSAILYCYPKVKYLILEYLLHFRKSLFKNPLVS